LPDGVLGIAWPSIRTGFHLSLEMAGYINIIVMCCCAISCFVVGNALKRFGTAVVTMVSCLITALSLLGYAFSSSYIWFFLMAVPLGFGKGAIDTGINYYVSNHYTSRSMSWLHCCWGAGAMVGTLIMTKAMIYNNNWRAGYVSLSVIQIFMVLLLLLSFGLWQYGKNIVKVDSDKSEKGQDFQIFKSPAPWIAVFLCFLFIGIESSVGLWANSMFVESRHIAKNTSGIWVSLFFGALMAGRFATGFVVNKLGNRFMIRLGIIVGIIGTVMLLIKGAPVLSIMGILLTGLGFAPIFPCMLHETPRRFDKKTSDTLIGYQMGFGYLGGSLLPALLGTFFSLTTLEMLMPCLIVVLFTMLLLSERLYNHKIRRSCMH